MSFDFPLLLFFVVVATGLITLVDILFFAKKRAVSAAAQGQALPMPKITEYARSFFPALLLVWVIRSFIAEPFVVPTGSLAPSIIPVEFTLVTQYNYGLRIPVWDYRLINISEPHRGDIVVCHWPVNPHIDFVKRVVAVPGDSISYINKVLYINGKEMKQTFVKDAVDVDDGVNGTSIPVKEYQENLDGVVHDIYINPQSAPQNFKNFIVPPHEYFMMGDNRDNSDDSRDWGLVPEDGLIGKAQFIWMSWDAQNSRVRWNRIGTRL